MDDLPADPETVIAILQPHVTPGRYRRMLGVAAVRTHRLTAILEEIHDPHNLAACARTADGLGLGKLHVVPAPPPESPRSRPPRDPAQTMGDTGLDDDPLSRAVSRRAERWLDITEHRSIGRAMETLRNQGYRVAAASLDPRARPIAALPLGEPVAVVFGNEKRGVSAEALARADDLITFPMRGFAQSFNVSVAFALVMGELRARLEVDQPHARWALTAAERTVVLARWLMTTVKSADAIVQRHLAERGQP